jgi:hypothetical protein
MHPSQLNDESVLQQVKFYKVHDLLLNSIVQSIENSLSQEGEPNQIRESISLTVTTMKHLIYFKQWQEGLQNNGTSSFVNVIVHQDD